MKTIEVIIDKDGNTKIEAKGFTDASCLAATKDIEEALGVAEVRTKKPEAYVSATAGAGATIKTR